MKKTWNNAEVTELNIQATAGGQVESRDYDGNWVQINGKWYVPGGDAKDGGENGES